jgi:hypothetical protein
MLHEDAYLLAKPLGESTANLRLTASLLPVSLIKLTLAHHPFLNR